MIRPRRTVSRAAFRAALAAVVALVFAGIAVTAETPRQRWLGVFFVGLALVQAWRESRRLPRQTP